MDTYPSWSGCRLINSIRTATSIRSKHSWGMTPQAPILRVNIITRLWRKPFWTSSFVPPTSCSWTVKIETALCLQKTGTMSRETGLIELQLRLPCGYVVGSGCVAVWLKANNSCPICRREFFPAQPRQYLEDSMIEGQEEEDHVEEEEADRLRMLERGCQEYSAQLSLFGQTVRSAQLIIRNLLRLYPFS